MTVAAGGGCGGQPATKLSTVFYPPPPQVPRVQFLVRYQNSKDLGSAAGGFRKFVTGESEKIDQLNKPHAAVLYLDKLYVCDSRRGQVVIMDLGTREMTALGEEESFTFGKPLSIAITADGTKYVADNTRKRIFVFDAGDRFLRSFGVDGQFGPSSVAVHGERLYVADIDDHEVEVLDRESGDVIATTTGSENSETGVFLMPANLTVDHRGSLYVTDLLSCNIHVFDSNLTFVRNISHGGDTFGSLGRPRGIAVDSTGLVFVADAAFENVQVFSPEGELLLFFGGPSVTPGGMYLPSGVTITYEGLDDLSQFADDRFEMEYAIVVANQYGPNGVSIYGFGKGKEGYFESSAIGPDRTPADSLTDTTHVE